MDSNKLDPLQVTPSSAAKITESCGFVENATQEADDDNDDSAQEKESEAV